MLKKILSTIMTLIYMLFVVLAIVGIGTGVFLLFAKKFALALGFGLAGSVMMIVAHVFSGLYGGIFTTQEDQDELPYVSIR